MKRFYIPIAIIVLAGMVIFLHNASSKLAPEPPIDEVIENCEPNLTKFKIAGISLEPVIKAGEVVEVDSNLCGGIRKGDIVAFKIGDTMYIKMVAALPEEQVETSGDTVIIKEGKFESRFLAHLLSGNNNQMPKNAYIVVGLDPNSIDSRRFGYIFREQMIGKVLMNASVN